MLRLTLALAAILAHLATPTLAAQDAPDEIVIRDILVVGPLGRGGRNPFQTDALIQHIALGNEVTPSEGDTIASATGDERSWSNLEADENGRFANRALRGGYAYANVHSDTDRVMLLDARGHSMVYVNGHPCAGDTYSNGLIIVPVQLNAGDNHFLFKAARGSLSAKIIKPSAPVSIERRDTTLPDIIEGESGPSWASVVVANNTTSQTTGIMLTSAVFGGADRSELVNLPPLSARKIAIRISTPDSAQFPSVNFQIKREDEVLDEKQWDLRFRKPDEKHRRTFISNIDGSVQYYGVTPAHPDHESPDKPALFLTLHGAGVEGMGQANAYSPKSWGHVIAPTNRRAFGFDWEDWGRVDAIEVLDAAQSRFNTDPNRTYLTGHSMGGHGAWQVGVQYPGRFAAIAPSAGWISFWSYTGATEYEDETPIENTLRRASNPSDTLALSRNYLHNGIYILHGDRDDNVPVDQARTMRTHLAQYHADFAYYERPGAGHWWGNACVDWPPLFDFFNRHTIPDPSAVHHVEFFTANPGINATSRWITIHNQIQQLAISSADITFNPNDRRFQGTTENVARLALNLDPFPAGGPISVELDGQLIEDVTSPAGTRQIYLARDNTDAPWRVADVPNPAHKGPHRSGPFKQAFTNRMVFVFGTAGTPDENQWAFDKARFDAETFWYRGNGSIDVVSDAQFLADEPRFKDRNVILFGNADSNSAWDDVLQECPVTVERGRIITGATSHSGNDLAALFVYPRANTTDALVAVVSGSGLPGMKSTDRLPYFVSGVHYPDWVVFTPEVWTTGTAAIRDAGYFDNQWKLTTPN